MPAGVHLKPQLNVRISEEARALLFALQIDLGDVGQAAALEVLLREAARERGIKLSDALKRYQFQHAAATRHSSRA